MKNIYFTFLFLLRAANKASEFLTHYNYDTGHPENDQKAKDLIKQLLSSDLLCSPLTFDESNLFKGERASLKRDFMAKFRNISEIMDCVACQTCKVHAKMQILGIGTALKILMAENKQIIERLQRNELIALINTLFKFSESIQIIHNMQLREQAKEEQANEQTQSISHNTTPTYIETKGLAPIIFTLGVIFFVYFFARKSRSSSSQNTAEKSKDRQSTKNDLKNSPVLKNSKRQHSPNSSKKIENSTLK